MKIVIVGATGTIGKHVTALLSKKHEVIRVGATKGDYQVDITSEESIATLFQTIGPFDALISTTGKAAFKPLHEMQGTDFKIGLLNKLMGQVNLVLIGQRYINPTGSFTLTSGILSEDPILAGTALSTVNGAINSFVKSASIELKNDVRINAVSPGVVEDSPELFDAFPGHIPVKMEIVTAAYYKSVVGALNGQIIRAY
ncbi:short chain dehydrogenase [Olivibacter domesticus]|uniref:NAD(P)-dependent dehydrogenase, short-chain alcohol dehydrogenase family n=1 Tax=Olivibacter domesticus TaxID=407022 RepID=A0A1H7Z7F0_OLID1|nr:short chain dehydrogenase [Olivibacter domesticus]SEM54151.1 NAD(P)-dependent dehydrogenase, short-chain alcohol dehydrogenase family [Olivibacter domesticus]